MSAAIALWIVLGAPVLQALLVFALPRPPGLRDVLHVGGALAVAAAALYLADAAGKGETARFVLAHPLPNVDLAFTVEPLGALMTATVAVLGALHAVHAAGYVRVVQEREPARLMAFVALAAAAANAAMLSANLFTLFVSLQALTLATFPLLEHYNDEPGRAAARIYLATLLAASAGLFLPAMVWVYALAGALDFQAGGVLAGRVDALTANVLLTLFVLGMAAAAIPPLHRWLPLASRAPFPGLIAIQALAVLPAGCVGLIKIGAFVFGPALQDAALAARGLIALLGVGMIAAALIALSRQDMRERLAYSCMAQALAAAMGVLVALPAGLFAAVVQTLALSCAAATLGMAAAAVFAVTGRLAVADYAGLGRLMPWTFAAFAIACASMIGLPPFAGAWAKLWLIAAATGAELVWAAVLAGAAAVLTFAHLAPVAATAFAARAPTDAFKRPDGAPLLLAAPTVLSAAATLWLLIGADALANYIAPIWSPR